MDRIVPAEHPVLPPIQRHAPHEWQHALAARHARRQSGLRAFVLAPIVLTMMAAAISPAWAPMVGGFLLLVALIVSFWYWMGESGSLPDVGLLQGGAEVHARVIRTQPGAHRERVPYEYGIDGEPFRRYLAVSRYDQTFTVDYGKGDLRIVLIVDPEVPWRHFVVPREGYEELLEEHAGASTAEEKEGAS